MRIRLIAAAGPAEGRTFEFDEPDVFVFGRGADAHCRIPNDVTISRNHFVVRVNPPDCYVVDLGSSNGTLVNGERYGGKKGTQGRRVGDSHQMVPLGDGDEIVAGKSRYAGRCCSWGATS